MRIRALTLAAALLTAPAVATASLAAAHFHEDDYCRHDDYDGPQITSASADPSSFALGTSGNRHHTWTVTAYDVCGVSDVDVTLYRNGSYDHASLSKIAGDGAGTATFRGTTLISASTLRNSYAGFWRVEIEARDENYNDSTINRPLAVKRAILFSPRNARPEPARRGTDLTITGRAVVASWDGRQWHGFSGRTVHLQARTRTGSYVTIKTVTTDSQGYLSTRVVAPSTDRCYRWRYAGSATLGASTSPGDCIDIY